MADPSPERSSTGKLERLLFFITPLIFTVILLGVLLTLFNIDIRSGIWKAASGIPLLKNVLPDSVLPDEERKDDESLAADTSEKIIKELKQRLADSEAALTDVVNQAADDELTIHQLQTQVKELHIQLETKQQAEQEYEEHIRELSSMYGKLSPSKAAKMMEQLAPEEQVLMLSGMKPEERMKLLERMDPKQAAEATVRLKDAVAAENLQIAALQARVKKLEQEAQTTPANTVTESEFAQTIAGMPPKNAAGLLLAMAKSNRNKALSVLSSVNNQVRSAILTAMAEQSESETVKLASELLSK